MDLFSKIVVMVPFVQFKKRGKHPWRSVTFSKVAGYQIAQRTTVIVVKFSEKKLHHRYLTGS